MFGGYASVASHVGMVATDVRGESELRVMTYNVFWKAFDETRETQCKSRAGNRCVKNMAYFIARYMPDILCLQEFQEGVQWPKLHAALKQFIPDFDNMYAWRSTQQGKAGMMTLFNTRKFQVDRVVSGDFLSTANTVQSGRPYLALLFTNGLLVVNVHMPHDNELVPATVDSCFDTLNALLSSIPHHQLIIAGDFNHDADANVFKLAPSLQSGNKQLNTCFNRAGEVFSLPFDHIYSNFGQLKSYTTIPAEQQVLGYNAAGTRRPVMSDHLPVFATFTL